MCRRDVPQPVRSTFSQVDAMPRARGQAAGKAAIAPRGCWAGFKRRRRRWLTPDPGRLPPPLRMPRIKGSDRQRQGRLAHQATLPPRPAPAPS